MIPIPPRWLDSHVFDLDLTYKKTSIYYRDLESKVSKFYNNLLEGYRLTDQDIVQLSINIFKICEFFKYYSQHLCKKCFPSLHRHLLLTIRVDDLRSNKIIGEDTKKQLISCLGEWFEYCDATFDVVYTFYGLKFRDYKWHKMNPSSKASDTYNAFQAMSASTMR